MVELFTPFILILALVVLVPMLVLMVEALAALLPSQREEKTSVMNRGRCAVLIPAHDEEAGIGGTIKALLPQLQSGDQLVVVADNCSDRTADAAKAALGVALGSRGGAVIERKEPSRRGKGYALDFGVRHLEKSPPEVVVVVDADCHVEDGALDRLVREASAGRPVQAAYLLSEPPNAGDRERLSAFAFKFKNLVRPLGLTRLGFPCLLTGTGMAFPWAVLRDAGLASGNIVEDMALGIDLAMAGFPPRLCARAQVRGELPAGKKAAATQRKRWEHGHIQTIFTQVPRLLGASWRRPALLGLALELSVPPLSLLFLLWAVVLVLSLGVLVLGGSAWPTLVALGGAAGVLAAIFAAWHKFGRDNLPLASLLSAPLYVLWKVPIYLSFLVGGRQKAWVRTERNAPPAPEGQPPPRKNPA